MLIKGKTIQELVDYLTSLSDEELDDLFNTQKVRLEIKEAFDEVGKLLGKPSNKEEEELYSMTIASVSGLRKMPEKHLLEIGMKLAECESEVEKIMPLIALAELKRRN